MKLRTRLALSAVAIAGTMAWGIPAGLAQNAAAPDQSSQDHAAHHPGAKEATPSPTPAPKESGGMAMGKNGQAGMMGRGGMMGEGDMMGGDMKQMMSMMHDMMSMMSAHTGMMPAFGDDKIAALKADLKITDAQAPLWNRFADVLRENGKSMSAARDEMMKTGMPKTLPERLDRHEKMLTSHLASLKTLKDALAPLYASFSDEQKKTADGLMVGPMGAM